MLRLMRLHLLVPQWMYDTVTALSAGKVTALRMNMDFRIDNDLPVDALVNLYHAVNWGAYTRDPDALHRAVLNSTCVISAWEGDRLVGLVRALSDGVSILYVQDILV